MSSKVSKFFTNNNEHWYVDTASSDDNEDRFVMIIDSSSIYEVFTDQAAPDDVANFEITLRGNCELARLLRSAHFQHYHD